MPSDNIPYRRLSGTGTGAFEQIRLYQGPDHLLLVSSSGYNESYMRFYFRDIQAITVRTSIRGKIWNGVWIFLAFLAAIIALQVGGVAMMVWSMIAGIFFILLAVHFSFGPTCICQIRTAVQTRALPSLNRLRRAQKVIARLRPIIERAQEPMSSSELSRRIDETRRDTAPIPVGNPPTASPDPSLQTPTG